MEISVKSSAFNNDGLIPSKFTCEGENISPNISWTTDMKGIKTFALICEDPDASSGNFVHWIVYNIPSNCKDLHEETHANRNLPDSAAVGTNDFHKIDYNGPCPPSGTHRYIFKLFGLNTILHLQTGASRKELMEAMKGHIIAEGELTGKYKRSKK